MPASGPSLNGIAAIKAIASASIANRTIVWDSSVHNAAKLYVYNTASTATADDDLILRPDDVIAANPGRWEKNVTASGAGGVTLDSVIATTLPNEPPGTPNYPSLKPTVAPTAIGETRFVYRRYSGTITTAFFDTYGLVVTRSAYYTAIGLTANDWITDRSAAVDIEYLTINGDPIGSNPGFSVESTFRVQADFPGQLCYTHYATVNGSGQSIDRAKMTNFDNGLPVAGSTTQWWEWQTV